MTRGQSEDRRAYPPHLGEYFVWKKNNILRSSSLLFSTLLYYSTDFTILSHVQNFVPGSFSSKLTLIRFGIVNIGYFNIVGYCSEYRIFRLAKSFAGSKKSKARKTSFLQAYHLVSNPLFSISGVPILYAASGDHSSGDVETAMLCIFPLIQV